MLSAHPRIQAPGDDRAAVGRRPTSITPERSDESASPGAVIRPPRPASWMWRGAKILSLVAEVVACVLAAGIGVQLFHRIGAQGAWALSDGSGRLVEGSALGMFGGGANPGLPAYDAYLASVPLVAWFIGLLFVLGSLFVLRAIMCLVQQID